jgi:hypothetical protein
MAVYIMSRWFNDLPSSKPVIIFPKDIALHIKNNSWLFIVCCVAGILHIYPLFYPILIIGDETQHLHAGLWIYEHIDVSWHKLFQIAFWAMIVLLLLIGKFKKADDRNVNRSNHISGLTTNSSMKYFLIFLFILFSVGYFLLLRNITYFTEFLRYPHLIKFLYHIVYSGFGITHLGPRVLQLVFYLLGAVYLYRTIMLFSSRESALTGATIYLFFPVMFAYAKLAEVGCGTVFFIILISFHFLRFIKQGDNRDILLTSFFIGTGFMYKLHIFVMFFVCILYLIARNIISKDENFKSNIKVMLVSLIPIMPWMIISKLYSWRNYKIIWSNFKPFEGKVYTFFLHFPLDISWALFSLFLFSIIFVLAAKRNALSLLFGLLFVAFYFFSGFRYRKLQPSTLYGFISGSCCICITILIQYCK